MTSAPDRPANQLVHETSPYLLQHAHNPVDWHPWGAPALARAETEDKPIFLSIGYAACHWCHVMEHESFENEDVAAFLNQHFVCIKVDREERPDLDDIYMKATQVLSGQGGWPMSVFLTPQRLPFYAGTYFPPTQRHGMPGFMQVLSSLAGLWERQREQLVEQAGKVAAQVRQLSLQSEHLPALGPSVTRPGLELVDAAVAQLANLFDARWGGFGGAPKFPHADDIRLCTWQHAATGDPQALHMARHTLQCMLRGGIFDQLGGGFARYSVDGEWTIPHFEKMLYDNALLVPALLETAAFGDEGGELADAARRTCEWVLAEMVDPAGGLWSTLDADSEGHEGRFYVWQRDEVLQLVGKQHAALVDDYWELGKPENFEGIAWNLRRPGPDAEVAERLGLSVDELSSTVLELRAKLLAARAGRVRPGTDDKVLTAWNGLMISALARAGVALDEPRFTAAARDAARFCLETLRGDDGRLLSTYRAGRARLPAHLADHAYLAAGLLDLFEATGEVSWADAALALVDDVRAHFADAERAGFFFTADDAEELLARPRDLTDGALPSSNGVMAEVLVRLGETTGRADLIDEVDRLFAMLQPILAGSPSAFARLLLALSRAQGAAPTVVLGAGAGLVELQRVLRDAARPGLSVLRVPAEGVANDVAARWPILAGKRSEGAQATAWVCRHGTCQAPITDAGVLEAALAS
ncbi:MAG: thioredoxin domain-containing protein [Planctomycetota bacterium]|nr:MAG: thioredoxin domain-containing protein [Planctomycetota bacterium]